MPPRNRALFFSSVLLAACTGGGEDSSTTGDTGGLSDPLADACTRGFSDTPEAWEISLPLESDYFMYSMNGLGDYWSLFDMTGDGLPELLISSLVTDRVSLVRNIRQ